MINTDIIINKKGFTLLEVLLAVVAIGILASIVLTAINPNRQIANVQDRARQADISRLQKAIDQYKIDNKGKTPALTGVVTGQYKDICPESQPSSTCVDLSFLVPNYISSVPKDPTGVSYKIGLNQDNNKLSLWADKSYQTTLAVNKFTPLLAAAAKDTTFDIGVPVGFDFIITALAMQSDGKIIAGGTFTSYQGVSSNRIIRLNIDGSRDTSFNMGTGFADNIVNNLAVQSDGKIIAGGTFTSYQGVSANGIIRLNSDGSRDTSFSMGTGFADNIVNNLAVQSDGKIIAGGTFTSYQGVSANGIIRLNSDGSRDSSFSMGTGFNSTVKTIAVQSDGKIIAGGTFTRYQGVSSNRIIRLNIDGSRDTSFNMGTGFADNIVNNLAVQSDGKIIAGGTFTSYQGVSANGIIRLNSDGSRDSSFSMGTGFASTTVMVETIAVQSDGKIVVGGGFTTYQGVTSNRIIRLNSDGSRDSGFNTGTGFGGKVNALVIRSDGKIVVGGDFMSYQELSANRIIGFNSDASKDNSFNTGTGLGSALNVLAVQSDGKIIAGGFFTTYQGVATNRIIRLNSDGSRDNIFNIGTGFDRNVNTLVLQSDGKVLVGGAFFSYQGVSFNSIIRLNSDGSIDTSFSTGTGFNSTVNTISVQSDGKILVGGAFTNYQGTAANNIIRLNSNGSIDTSFSTGTGFNSTVNTIPTVNTISVHSDGKIIVGGGFTTYQGVNSNRIIRLNSNGSIDASFSTGTGFNSTVNTISVHSDGKIIVGGGFTTYQGVNSNRIIRLNSNGSIDTSFSTGTGFNSAVNTISVHSDGKIIVGGGFTTYQGVTSNRIIRLNSDGSIDTSFSTGTGFNSVVNNIAIQGNRNIVVGGYFTNYQDQPAGYLIRMGY